MATRSFTSPAWWQWPTVLSLDAPAVCVCWQALLAHFTRTAPAWPPPVLLAASVWLAYAADRWIEGWRLDADAVRTQRHSFYQRHRVFVAVVWLVVLTADIVVASTHLERGTIARGLALVAAVAAYLVSHQFLHRAWRWRVPKEILTSLLLTSGVAVFLRPVSRGELAPGLAVFAVVAFANCALISSWEREVDRAHGQTSLALESARAARAIGWLPWGVAGVGALLAVWAPAPARVAIACGVASAIGLGIVDRASERLGRRAVRVLADAALLTPVVPLLWIALR